MTYIHDMYPVLTTSVHKKWGVEIVFSCNLLIIECFVCTCTGVILHVVCTTRNMYTSVHTETSVYYTPHVSSICV
jgi:uncharacterized membrane protein